MESQEGSQRKPKSYYVDYTKRSSKSTQWRGGRGGGAGRYGQSRGSDISYGCRGFLITSIDEAKSYLEMRNVLEEYYEKLYQDKSSENLNKGDMQAEDELELELKQLRVTKPFKQVRTHCRNNIFVNIRHDFPHVDPAAIVCKFFDDLGATQELRTSNTFKVLPVIDTFRNSVSCARESIKNQFEGKFNDESSKNYFIEFQSRGNYKLESAEKQQIVEGVAEEVSSLRPDWKVSRDNVDYMIVMVAMKNVCCLSILENYFQRCKYNVIEFCKQFDTKDEDGSVVGAKDSSVDNE